MTENAWLTLERAVGRARPLQQVTLWVPFIFSQAARLLLCFLSKSHQHFCKPRLLLRNQPVCREKSDTTRGRGCRVRPFTYQFV